MLSQDEMNKMRSVLWSIYIQQLSGRYASRGCRPGSEELQARLYQLFDNNPEAFLDELNEFYTTYQRGTITSKRSEVTAINEAEEFPSYWGDCLSLRAYGIDGKLVDTCGVFVMSIERYQLRIHVYNTETKETKTYKLDFFDPDMHIDDIVSYGEWYLGVDGKPFFLHNHTKVYDMESKTLLFELPVNCSYVAFDENKIYGSTDMMLLTWNRKDMVLENACVHMDHFRPTKVISPGVLGWVEPTSPFNFMTWDLSQPNQQLKDKLRKQYFKDGKPHGHSRPGCSIFTTYASN